MSALIVEEQRAAFTAGEWSGARQEIQNCLTQLEANETKSDGLAGLREILPPEATFPSDQDKEAAPLTVVPPRDQEAS